PSREHGLFSCTICFHPEEISPDPSLENKMKYMCRTVVFLALCMLAWAQPGFGQGVTTGSIAGIVTDNQQRPVAGASVLAIHEPSGTTYEGTTRADGRYSIIGMRVGGPYSVQVTFVGQGTAFEPKTVE